ncbi:hypothetical protein LJB95_01510 [Paludibacteraceae bacterium OttesenSCG-928-F17]|nr:hypothetical protein [Paludibacteraceae bacterium OttesenSCG-928-F17]
MKEFRTVFAITFIAGWIIYFLVNWLFSLLGRPLDYFNVIIVGIVISFLYTLILNLVVRSLLKPKLEFLKSETGNVPPFGNKLEKSFTIDRSDFSFEVIKYKVKEQKYHVILYEDTEKYIMKFYTGAKLTSWGIGGSIEYDAVTKTIHLACFPFSAYTEKAATATENIMNKVENLIINK